ncbi:scavenger receptor class B member 1-like isoform X2 [Varroa destructor]|nr:scavenger receptor class B member 1-like isoform X2 [Varroa destructor]XP_022654330.1 scavenger receptor class B member 1-like isoform X2 [Varroa destructor]
MKSRGIAGLGISCAFFLVACLSLLAYLKIPSFLQLAVSRSGLSPGSFAADLFSAIPFDIRQNVYMFNITNSEDFFNGAKPRFKQLGPYIFRIGLRKQMTWSEGDLLTFRENRKFWFDADLSHGHLNDTVYTVDPIYAMAQEVIDELPEFLERLFRPLLKSRKVLFKHSVDELLYNGYSDSLAELAHLIKPNLPVIGGKIGYLRAFNDTDDGDITVFAGTNPFTKDKRNLITQWNHKKTIPYYGDGCNGIWGANAELFPSFLSSSPPAQIGVFLPLLCRPWSLHFNETRQENGIELARFATGLDIFSPSNSSQIEQCAQPAGWPRGVFDVRACQHSFPALISLPHFLHSDEKILDAVDGLTPNVTEHDFHLDIFPLLGIPVRPAIRAQINVRIWRHLDTSQSNNPPIVYPVLWQEIVLSESAISYLSTMIWYIILLPETTLRVILMLLTILSVSLAVSYAYTSFSKVSDEETESILASAEDSAASS